MNNQINKVNNFGHFFSKTGKREKIFLNGYEMWLDRNELVLYDKEQSRHGLVFDVYGEGDNIYINDLILREGEKKELINYLKNGG